MNDVVLDVGKGYVGLTVCYLLKLHLSISITNLWNGNNAGLSIETRYASFKSVLNTNQGRKRSKLVNTNKHEEKDANTLTLYSLHSTSAITNSDGSNHQTGRLAQLVERTLSMREVWGSKP